jgi:VIT1/CCC1 family predicted Fe2+/Mn2+ transporter
MMPAPKTDMSRFSFGITSAIVTSLALFVAAVLTLPLTYAITISMAAGLALLTVLSYYIALNQKTSIAMSMVHHLGIAVVVLFLSHFLGQLIGNMFHV